MSASPEEPLAQENRRLRQENEALRLQRETLQSQQEALRIQLQELEIIRRNLEHTIAVYKRCLFGSRSETIDPKELERRIAQAAREAREQLAQQKRPGDPPPEAEEEQPETTFQGESAQEPATHPKPRDRSARPVPMVEDGSQPICHAGASSIRSIRLKRCAGAARIIPR